ncbi:MAG: class I SAM-dependent methyltransferase [Candidatus Lernaella stagnicola]|nr:class I SAM-dependent methyltransferase [Candidatus Lernaella stagnicola]
MTDQVTTDPLYHDPEAYDIAYGWNSLPETRALVGAAEHLLRRPVRRALEVGCGSGRVLRDLVDLGVDAVGLDHNPRLLDYAQRRLDETERDALLIRGDMRAFRLAKPVDLVLAPINGIGYLTDPGDTDRHLDAVARNLRPGGVYIVEICFGPVEPELIGRRKPWTFTRGRTQVTADFILREVDQERGWGMFEASLRVRRGGESTEIVVRHTLRIWDQPQFYAAIERSPLRLAELRRRDETLTPIDAAAPLTFADDNVFVVLQRPRYFFTP